ncbi:ABC transporter ATP-binding protein [Mesorhizobium sp. ASY16-5R]|jgi:branched-chain amino acid transport system ATP-binding protein|uniref:ABC transporter ATP-binding protein n=1 Tax=Mesorhizobium sp. ASY16-5R TaxID=3445772 RepID=UPI003FA1069D
MLRLEDADVFYGKAQALGGVSIEVREGEVVGLVGRNGAGKSTILKTLMGLLTPTRGRRIHKGEDITSLPPQKISRRGVAFVPENRQIFPNLTVEENLRLAGVMHKPGFWTYDRACGLFPRLRERARSNGSSLSGGEQQMLSIARALMTNPTVLMLDEPSEGLAPLVVRDVRDAIVEIHRQGMAILLVEQKVAIPMSIGQRIYVVDHGTVGWSGTTAEFAADRAAIENKLAI